MAPVPLSPLQIVASANWFAPGFQAPGFQTECFFPPPGHDGANIHSPPKDFDISSARELIKSINNREAATTNPEKQSSSGEKKVLSLIYPCQ
jgi:hypothetical protein